MRRIIVSAATLVLAAPFAHQADAAVTFVNQLKGSGSVQADFNGDGFDDLAIGTPFKTVGGDSAAGEVTVVYGSAAGLDSGTAERWSQDTPTVVEAAEPDDEFGSALAAGDSTIEDDAEAGDGFGGALTSADYDGDNRDDLAVAAFGEEIPLSNEGAVHVIYGAGGDQFLHQTRVGRHARGR